jgi:hypothetical protein
MNLTLRFDLNLLPLPLNLRCKSYDLYLGVTQIETYSNEFQLNFQYGKMLSRCFSAILEKFSPKILKKSPEIIYPGMIFPGQMTGMI